MPRGVLAHSETFSNAPATQHSVDPREVLIGTCVEHGSRTQTSPRATRRHPRDGTTTKQRPSTVTMIGNGGLPLDFHRFGPHLDDFFGARTFARIRGRAAAPVHAKTHGGADAPGLGGIFGC